MKQRLFTVAASMTALLAGVVWVGQGVPSQTTPPSVAAPSETQAEEPLPTPRPSVEVSSVGSATEGRLYSYAIATTELQGLSPGAGPGTRLDLWVATQPPVSQKADMWPLLEGAILHEIVPPFLPDGPSAAVLQIPMRHARKLMWADKFGSLSVLEVRPLKP